MVSNSRIILILSGNDRLLLAKVKYCAFKLTPLIQSLRCCHNYDMGSASLAEWRFLSWIHETAADSDWENNYFCTTLLPVLVMLCNMLVIL